MLLKMALDWNQKMKHHLAFRCNLDALYLCRKSGEAMDFGMLWDSTGAMLTGESSVLSY